MGHAHAVEGFAHNPLGLTTRFFAARDWDAPTFDDYRRGWLAGMLELVARTAGASTATRRRRTGWSCLSASRRSIVQRRLPSRWP